MDIEWIDPPHSDIDEWDEMAALLRAKPGRWARVNEGAYFVARERTTEPLEDRGIETRFIPTGGTEGTYGYHGDIYARAPEGA